MKPLSTLLIASFAATVATAAPKLTYADLPLSFHASPQGFTSSGRGYHLTLKPAEAVFALQGPQERASLRLRMQGANPAARLTPADPLPGRIHYVNGPQWRLNVQPYGRVKVANLYPGVDVVYYGNQGQLEYDFIVQPGADLNQVRMQVEGAGEIRTDAEGNLLLSASTGQVLLQKPVLYQEIAGRRRPVDGRFIAQGNTIGFEAGDYDHRRALVVDPVLKYATYVGRGVNDRVNGVAVAPDDTLWLAGLSPGDSANSHDEGFVAHLSADGKKLLSMTYLGATGPVEARALALAADGAVYVTGQTTARDFPLAEASQQSCGAGPSGDCTADAFLVKLHPDGTPAVSTYYGGPGVDAGNAVALAPDGQVWLAGGDGQDAWLAVFHADGRFDRKIALAGSGVDEALGLALDAEGRAYVAGRTASRDLPVRHAVDPQCLLPGGCGFAARLHADGSWDYVTYLPVDAARAIAVDPSGQAHLAGDLRGDAVVTKLSADGAERLFTRTIAGSAPDAAHAIAVDGFGAIYVAGTTESPDFPLASPLQDSCALDAARGVCSREAFVLSLTADGHTLAFSTFLGGAGAEQGRGLALNASGDLVLGGAVASAHVAAPAVVEKENRAGAARGAIAPSPLPGGGLAAVVGGVQNHAACSGSINWDGGGGDRQWTTAANWNPNTVPGSGSNVCIDVAFAGQTITIASPAAANQTINSLVSNAHITFTAGALTIMGTAAFDGNLAVSGGTLRFSLGLVAGTMTQSGGIVASVDRIDVGGLLTWTGGSLCRITACNSGVGQAVNANSGFAISGGVTLNGRPLINKGTATIAGTLTMTNAARLENPSGRSLTLNGATVTGSSSSFTNAGTLTASGATSIQHSFTNTGVVQSTAGTLTISDVKTSTGSWNAAGTSSFSFAGTATLSSSLTTPNEFRFTGIGGAINLTGTYNVTAATGATRVSGGTATFPAAVTLTSLGTLHVDGGTAHFATGSPMNLGTVFLSVGTIAGPDELNISGLLTWTGGSICHNNTCGATNGSAVNANGGIALSTTAAKTLSGRTLTNNGAATLAGNLALSASAGLVNPSGRNMTLNSAVITHVTTNGFTSTVSNAGTLTAGGSNSIAPPFVNTSSVQATAGTLTISAVTDSAGSWNAAGFSTIAFAGTASLTGSLTGYSFAFQGGAITVTGGTYNTTWNTFVFGGGTVTFQAPVTLTSMGSLQVSAGIAHLATGSPLNLVAMNLSGTGIIAGPDVLNITGLFTWTGGSLCSINACNATGTGVTNANGGLSIPSGAPQLLGRRLNTSGTSTLSSSASLVLSQDAILENQPGAIWNMAQFNLSNGTIGGTFSNLGTVTKTLSSGTVSVPVTNAGTIQIAAGGTFNLNNSYTQSAGALNVTGSILKNTSSAMIINGGSVGGGGSLTTLLTNSAGALSPGGAGATSTLTLAGSSPQGAVTMGAASALNIELGGTAAGQVDVLAAARTAALDGALNVSLLNGFMPAVGNTFTILTAPTGVTGTFATVNLPPLAPGRKWDPPTYNATSVVLKVGQAPAASVAPGNLPFPDTTLSTPSAAIPVTLSNIGLGPLTITNIAVTGADAAHFAQTNNCPASLAANASCTVNVTFSPTSLGPKEATLVFTNNDNLVPGSTQAVTLSGTGVTVSMVDITLDTSPANLLTQINNGPLVNAPHVTQHLTGSMVPIAAPTPQIAGDFKYLFTGWSDGGAATHNILVPGTNTTYTATFDTHYRLNTLISPAGAGTIDAAPASADNFYAPNTAVTLTPSGDCFTGFSPSGTVNLTGPITVTASFDPTVRPVTFTPGVPQFIRTTNRWRQAVTITTATAIANPRFVVTNLSAGVTLVSPTPAGLTSCIAPAGSRYFPLTFTGNTATIVLEFTKVTPTTPLTYTPKVTGGSNLP